jgi:hypothetical protein
MAIDSFFLALHVLTKGQTSSMVSSYVQVCVSMYQYIRVHTDIYRYIPVCTAMSYNVQLCISRPYPYSIVDDIEDVPFGDCWYACH